MTKKIVLARHAQCYANLEKRFAGNEPSHITYEGILEARSVADRFRRLGVRILYSSTLERAEDTAVLVASEMSDVLGAVTFLPELRERDYSPFSGQLMDDVFRSGVVDFSSVPGVETPKALLERTVRGLFVMYEDMGTATTAAAITHGSNIKVIRAMLDGADIPTYYTRPSVKNVELTELTVSRDSNLLIVADAEDAGRHFAFELSADAMQHDAPLQRHSVSA